MLRLFSKNVGKHMDIAKKRGVAANIRKHQIQFLCTKDAWITVYNLHSEAVKS